jgi:hypothetical protein
MTEMKRPSSSSPTILLLNQNWLTNEFRQLGYSVVSAGFGTPHLDHSIDVGPLKIWDLLEELKLTPDYIVYFDDSGLPWLTELEECPISKLFYSIDSHHHCAWHSPFGGLFDFVLTAHKDHLDQFLRYNQNSRWMPLWATVNPEPSAVRNIQACFRGSMDPQIHPGRADFFEQLKKVVPLDAGPGLWLEAYPRAKIVINQSVASDLNFRIFEAMISGALLITPRINNGLLDLFIEDQELVLYENGSPEDASRKIAYFLANEDERKSIADRGREKVLTNHSNLARATEIASILSGIQRRILDQSIHNCALSTYLFTSLARQELNLPPSSELALAANNAIRRGAANTKDERSAVDIIRTASNLLAADLSAEATELLTFAANRTGSSKLLDLFAAEALLKLENHGAAAPLLQRSGLAESTTAPFLTQLLAPIRLELGLT